jgi:transcription elongation factor Elf1
MDYKIFSNIRTEPDDFKMSYGCSFCDKFNSKVLKIPDTDFLICHSCLYAMMRVLEKAMMEDII